MKLAYKKTLMNLLGIKRGGRKGDCEISHALIRRGIVHFPKRMPKHRDAILLLMMQGPTDQKQIEQFFAAIFIERAESVSDANSGNPPVLAMPATATTAGEQLRNESQICSECGQRYSVDEIAANHPGYWEAPYNYGDGSRRYCLACWLGVGPKDVARVSAELEEEFEGRLAPSDAFCLTSERELLGLSRRDLAKILGVCEKTVWNWETKGLPKHGTGALTVRATLERIREERRNPRAI